MGREAWRQWVRRRLCCFFCLGSPLHQSVVSSNKYCSLLGKFVNSGGFCPQVTCGTAKFCSISLQLKIPPERSCTRISLVTDYENQIENLGILHSLQSEFIAHPLNVQSVFDHSNDRDEYLVQISVEPILVCSLDWVIEGAKRGGIASLPLPFIRSVLLSLIGAFEYVHSNGYIIK